jgi:hypothetical protein
MWYNQTEMIDLTISVFCIGAILLLALAVFYFAQVVFDRFWLYSFPILIEVYGRWRYPERYKDEDGS